MSTNIIGRFMHAMQEHGIETEDVIVGDGQLHRFRVTGDKPGKDNGWYVLHLDGPPSGAFGCWKRDTSATWCAKESFSLTEPERRELSARIERQRREQDAERQQVRAECKAKADRYWQKARDTVSADHPYLLAKGVKPYGLRQLGDNLLVPVRNADGDLVSLQYITRDGTKRFQTGTPKTGNFCAIEGNTERVLICEGFATGASLREATGHMVVVAFDCGNLLAVAQTIRTKLPNAVLVLCADNDHRNPNNPGRSHALTAARAVGGLLAVPTLADNDTGTDFNDLHQHQGLRAVVDCVVSARALEAEATMPSPPESQDDLIRRIAALSGLTYFQAQKDSAKTLGITVGQLHKLVMEERTAASGSAEGSTPLFAEVEPWPDPVDGAALLADLSASIRRYVICEPTTADAAALWAMFTWLIDSVSVAPIAMITAPEMRCGKTVMLSFLGKVSCRPLAAANISAAAIFRCVEQWTPTLIIDEADAFLRDNEEARGILNSGHTRDAAYVLRIVGDDHIPCRFSTWGAKAIAGIGKLSATLTDRSIPLVLRRKLPGESVEKLRRADGSMFEAYCRRMSRWATDNAAAVRNASPAPLPINDRAQDNWEPLLAIADVAGGEWPPRSRRAAMALSGEEQDAPSTNTELLTDIKAIFERLSVDRISSTDLLAALCEDEESPWPTWHRGKPMTARQLATRLHDFGIVSNSVRIGDRTPKGYYLSGFQDAFARYLAIPPSQSATPPQPSNGGVFSDSSIRNSDDSLRLENLGKPNNGGACGGVADNHPGVITIYESPASPIIQDQWEQGAI